jgi:hypothetical protein
MGWVRGHAEGGHTPVLSGLGIVAFATGVAIYAF